MRLTDSIQSTLKRLIDAYNGLSLREKVIIVSSFFIVIPMVLHEIAYVPVRDAFTEQTETLEKASQDLTAMPHILNRYKKLKAKKDEIENEFRQVEIKEGEQSLLENILSGKVEPGFDITPMNPQPFGGSYEQANFNVRFATSSLSNVVDILTEISTGKKRMLLTTMSISKDSSGEKLRVELGVSSIRQKNIAS